MFFYVSICDRCNTGLDGDRYAAPHPLEECNEFLRVRKLLELEKSIRTDQIDLQKVLAYEHKHGKLPERETV